MGIVAPSLAQLDGELEAHREQGRGIVTTNGVFDLLHVGHVRYLQAARALGDLLVVGVNSDRSTRALKGVSRPFVPESERAEVLAALACVDYVVVFDELTPVAFVRAVRPAVHAKGGDYCVDDMPETPIVRGFGGDVVTLPFVGGRSTSGLAARMAEEARK